MKEVKEYQKAKESIELSHKIMTNSIKNLLIKGYTFGEIAKMFGKKSRQSVFQFYRYNIKKSK